MTIPDRSTKQIELFETAREIPARKVLMYDGTAGAYWNGAQPMMDQGYGVQSNAKVAVYLEFDNDDAHGLGIPLPSGRVRVNQTDDADGSQEFIGEDVIDHTPRGEEVRIKLGNAFDVNFGLSGLDKWATEVTDDRSKKGWPARFGNGAGFEHAMGRVAECFTYSYSAPGATRPIYAEFLQEAAGTTPLALEPAAQLAAQNGQLWEEVVEVAAAATDPTTAFTRIGQLARTLHAEETKLVEALDVAVSA